MGTGHQRYDLDIGLGLFGAGSSGSFRSTWRRCGTIGAGSAQPQMLLNPAGRWILMTYDDPLCTPANQVAWKRFSVAEYLHDNEKIIGSTMSGVVVGNVSGYGIYVGGPRSTPAAAGESPVVTQPARTPPAVPGRFP